MGPVVKFLKSPKTIVAEVTCLTAALALSTAFPDSAGADAGAGESYPALGAAARFLGLDSLVSSSWFLALLVLAALSLTLVLVDQVRRAARLVGHAPTAEGLAQAPYRREAFFAGAALPRGPSSEVRVKGGPGAWGSPLFHLGLLLVLAAGLLRMLFGAEAAVDLIAGETLAPEATAYGTQQTGLLAAPFAFPVPIRLESLSVTRYPSGEVEGVEGTLAVGEGAGAKPVRIGINHPLTMGAHSLYLRSIGGAAALLEVGRDGVLVERHAVLLRDFSGGASGQVTLGDGTLLRIASNGGGIGLIPKAVDLRALRGTLLAASVRLGPKADAALPGGTRVRLVDLVPWVQFSGRRDVSTPVVYVGFSLATLGGLLMFAVVRVERAVVREAVEGGVRLTVLMRPQRFVPLFATAFEALWARNEAELQRGAGGETL